MVGWNLGAVRENLSLVPENQGTVLRKTTSVQWNQPATCGFRGAKRMAAHTTLINTCVDLHERGSGPVCVHANPGRGARTWVRAHPPWEVRTSLGLRVHPAVCAHKPDFVLGNRGFPAQSRLITRNPGLAAVFLDTHCCSGAQTSKLPPRFGCQGAGKTQMEGLMNNRTATLGVLQVDYRFE